METSDDNDLGNKTSCESSHAPSRIETLTDSTSQPEERTINGLQLFFRALTACRNEPTDNVIPDADGPIFQFVPGMASNVQFMTHEKNCDRECVILFEAEMCVALAQHLLRQDLDPSQIIIVTTTHAQKKEIEDKIIDADLGNDITSVRVDHIRNYLRPGAYLSNEVLILSLCSIYRSRTNPFLSSIEETHNLSVMASYIRSCCMKKRLGLYMVGHISLLRIPGTMQDICSGLNSLGIIQPEFILRCRRHNVWNYIRDPKKIEQESPYGGCRQLCMKPLPNCDHKCPFICHGTDPFHYSIKCTISCENLCPFGHVCGLPECGVCEPCQFEVQYVCVMCGSLENTVCSRRYCTAQVSSEPQAQAVARVDLPELVEIELVESDRYQTYIDWTISSLGGSSSSSGDGIEDGFISSLEALNTMIPIVLELAESEPELPPDLVTEQLCQRTVCSNGHTCSGRAIEPCKPCTRKVEIKFKDCEHTLMVDCGTEKEYYTCKEIVESHEVDCGHRVSIECALLPLISDKELTQLCTKPCQKVWPCGHMCSGSCKDCNHGIFHIRCTMNVDILRSCGHTYTGLCSEFDYCTQPCTFFCEHGKCQLICGIPCTPCMKLCTWECQHYKCTRNCSDKCNRRRCWERCPKLLARCGHPCLGYCGLPCPDLCATCDKEKLSDSYLLGQDVGNPGDRFVALECCGHILEAESMHMFMKTNSESNPEETKKCPFCRAVIWNCRQYTHILTAMWNAIQDSKLDLYGDPTKSLTEKLNALVALTESDSRMGQSELFKVFRTFLMVRLVGETEAEKGKFDINMSTNCAAVLGKLAELAKVGEKYMYGMTRIRASAFHKKMLFGIYDRLFRWIMGRPFPPNDYELKAIDSENDGRAKDMYKLFKAYYAKANDARVKHDIDQGLQVGLFALQLLRKYSEQQKSTYRRGLRMMNNMFDPLGRIYTRADVLDIEPDSD